MKGFTMIASGSAPDGWPRAGGFARLALIVSLACGCAAGCSGSGVRAVDEQGAREALRAALEAWKHGTKIESLKELKPSIVAQDLDWESGRTLVDFQIRDEGAVKAANMSIPVEIVLRDDAGKEVKKKVKYMVGTSPVITVFREIF
jgi:hypothetical protein